MKTEKVPRTVLIARPQFVEPRACAATEMSQATPSTQACPDTFEKHPGSMRFWDEPLGKRDFAFR